MPSGVPCRVDAGSFACNRGGSMESQNRALSTTGGGRTVIALDAGGRWAEAADALTCGPLWISPGEMCELRVAGGRVPMSLCHLRMLACLLEARGRVVSREELYRSAGAAYLPQGSRRVDVHVTRIRQSLGVLGRYLVAVRRRGYRLDTASLGRLGSGPSGPPDAEPGTR